MTVFVIADKVTCAIGEAVRVTKIVDTELQAESCLRLKVRVVPHSEVAQCMLIGQSHQTLGPNEGVMGQWTGLRAFPSLKGHLLCNGRNSADGNQEEWFKRMHLDKEARGKLPQKDGCSSLTKRVE